MSETKSEITAQAKTVCKKLTKEGWKVEARIDETDQNGVQTFVVGMFFTKGTKRKFAGYNTKERSRADHLLKQFQSAIDSVKK